MARLSSSMLVTWLAAVATGTLLPACADLMGEADPGPGPSSIWESAVTTTDDGAIAIQKVAYRSGDLRIVGQVCRPHGPGPFPLVVANHGGVSGLTSWNGGACAATARGGAIQIESAYRGQDGSQGAIELCLGEVDDVLRMLELALAMPEVDPTRVTMWGADLGGCITARAIQRGAPVAAAASVFGVAYLGATHEHWQEQLEVGTGPAVQYQMMLLAAQEAIGAGPRDRPQEYMRRSPLAFAGDLPSRVPFLLAHGGADPLVPPRQSCELAQRLGIEGHHVDAQHERDTATPAGCESAWRPSTDPITGWPASRYLLVYGGLGHELLGPAAEAMLADVHSFLAAKAR